jgi:hypothetical protein
VESATTIRSSQHDSILLMLGRLEGKVDSFMSRQLTLESEIRATKLEVACIKNAQSKMLGYALGVAAISGLIFNYILRVID